MDLRSKIVALLGLDPQADDNAILQALGACAQKAAQSEQPDPAKWVPIGDFQRTTTELNRLRQGISQQAAEERVDGDIRKGVLPPFTKDWAVSLCMSNVPAYDQFIKNVGPGFSYLWNKIGTPSLHSEATELTENEKAVARNLGLSDKEFIASRGKN